MSCAKKFSSLSSEAEVIADIFIDEMREETGCSATFLSEARPSIIKLYRDVTGDALENCLDEVRTLIRQQAETEKTCERVREDAKKLEAVHEQLNTEIKAVRAQIIEMRNSLQHTAFSLFSVNNIVGRA
ncbi:MAG: hypothetical protein JXX29_14615 [Deltaproteobacteria bacterium]|nr:hypothetical protein [Deltaproteobacteria bacterium]MBN2672913.1 hypothetical protein [Deltaproteobacteria bacterium]